MSALSTYLRERAAEDIRSLEPDDRIELALRLGDDDLALYCAAKDLAAADARNHLRQLRQSGRRPSPAAHR